MLKITSSAHHICSLIVTVALPIIVPPSAAIRNCSYKFPCRRHDIPRVRVGDDNMVFPLFDKRINFLGRKEKSKFPLRTMITSTKPPGFWTRSYLKKRFTLKFNNTSRSTSIRFETTISTLRTKSTETIYDKITPTKTMKWTFQQNERMVETSKNDAATPKPTLQDTQKSRRSQEDWTESDERPSAVGLGSVGVLIIFAILVGIVVLDSATIYRDLRLLKARLSAWCHCGCRKNCVGDLECSNLPPHQAIQIKRVRSFILGNKEKYWPILPKVFLFTKKHTRNL